MEDADVPVGKQKETQEGLSDGSESSSEGGESSGDAVLSGEELDPQDTAALLDEIAKDPPKADPIWKRDVSKIDALLQRRHGKVVKLHWHPVKGRILLSRRKYVTDEVILTDRALLMIPKPSEDENDLWCKLLETCTKHELPLEPIWYWTALMAACPSAATASRQSSRVRKPPTQVQMDEDDEDAIAEDLEKNEAEASAWLTPPSAVVGKRLSMLYRPDVQEPSLEVMIVLYELGLRSALDALRVEEFLQTAIQNSFQCYDEQDRSNLGMWFTPSFVSHSCIPNAAGVVDSTGVFTLVAQRMIKPGEEICISYIDSDCLRYDTAYRRTTLAKSRRFVCACPRCAGADAIKPAACFVCGQILLYVDTGEASRRQHLCKRLASQAAINTYVWSHIFFCALSGGNI
jgi:hypothetical protein